MAIMIANVKDVSVVIAKILMNHLDISKHTILGCCRILHSSEKLQLCEIMMMMMVVVVVYILKDHTLQLNLYMFIFQGVTVYPVNSFYLDKFPEPLLMNHLDISKHTSLGCRRILYSSEKLQLCEIITMMMMMMVVVYLKDQTLQLNL